LSPRAFLRPARSRGPAGGVDGGGLDGVGGLDALDGLDGLGGVEPVVAGFGD